MTTPGEEGGRPEGQPPASDPNDPNRAYEYPSLEQSGRPVDPFAPIDYPPTYPAAAPGSYPPPPPAFPPPYQPQYGTNPYDPYWSTRPTGTNGMAIGSLVASLAGLACCGLGSVVGLVLGIMALREIRQTGQQGHGLALAGTIIGGISTGLFVIVLILYLIGVAVGGTPS